jgi:Fic family protein
MVDFIHNLDPDLRAALLTQLRNLWTHTSTAIEGNTLSLGEIAFVLEDGLTVAGKPLKDHQEVVGHARAIDLLYDCLREGKAFAESDMFDLHRAVQTEVITDFFKPVGAWKKEPNSTAGMVNGRQVIFEYGPPEDIPLLMGSWFELFNRINPTVRPGDTTPALAAYVQLHVYPSLF